MDTAAELSIILLASASLIVLMLDAIGNHFLKPGNLEKPHINLVAMVSLFGSLSIFGIDFFAKHDLKDDLLLHTKLGSIFLIINTIISSVIIKHTSIKKPNGPVYFLLLSSLAISLHSLSTNYIIFKFVSCLGWMMLTTTLAILSTSGGRKAEIGLKLSFSSLLFIILFISVSTVLIYGNFSQNISLLDIKTHEHYSHFLIPILMVLAGMSLSGVPPFHSGFIDCVDGGNIGTAFLLISNSSILGCSLLLSSQHIIRKSPLLISNSETLGLILILGFILLWIRALDQSKIRRTIAYIASSISPLFSISIFFGSSILLPKLIFLIVIYSFITLSLSVLFGSLSHMNSVNQPWHTWEDLSGFGRVNPWHMLIFLVALSSIAGIPGTLGYFIKLSLIAPMQENLVFSGLIFLSIAIGSACIMRFFVFGFSKHGCATDIVSLAKPSLFLALASLVLIGLGLFPFVS